MRLLPPTVRTLRVRCLLLAALLPVSAAAAAPADPADLDLADRFEGLAELTFPAKVPTGDRATQVFYQQAALLRAAATLDPKEPRYSRKLAEALNYAGDADGEYQALSAVLTNQPGDEFTWLRLVELKLAPMQSADKQIAWLSAIERSPNLPRDVLAQAGARHAQILYDQGKERAARTLLTSVLTNDPLNLDALQLQYRLLPKDTTPYARLQALLSILRSNPLQPAYAREAAELAAEAGLVESSLPFYRLSFNTGVARRQADWSTALDWAAELYIGNQNVDAYRFVQQLLGANPNYPDAWDLDLLVVRSSGFSVAQQDQDLQRATVVMSNRLADVVNAVVAAAGPATRPSAGGAAAVAAGPRATTRPIDTDKPFPLPDVTGALAVLKRADADAAADVPPANPVVVAPVLRQAFITALTDLARLEIYFAHKPDAATPFLGGLRAVLGPDAPLVTQLQGLQDFVAGQTDQARLSKARSELAALGKTDALAGIAVVKMMPQGTPAEQQAADAAARTLLGHHAAGLVGAFATEALVSPRVRLVPDAKATGPLDRLLQGFPQNLFDVGGQPQQLYTIHVEPVDVSRAVGQPLLARITLFNFSPVGLTIGRRGVLQPDLAFVMSPAVGKQPTDYTAVDDLVGPVVLRPREPLTQVVRVDQPALLAVLEANVRLPFEVNGQAVINGQVGLAGYTQGFSRPFVRTAANEQAVAVAEAELNGGGPNAGGPRERMTAVGVLQAYVREMQAGRNLPAAVQQGVDAAALAVHRAASDAQSPAVSAWGAQADFALAPADARPGLIATMANDANWRKRQLALLLVDAVHDPALARRVTEQLQADPQPSVQQYAKAALALAKLPPPPPPATRPAALPVLPPP